MRKPRNRPDKVIIPQPLKVMTKKWAVSLLALQQATGGVSHAVGLIEATSEDEARGRALRAGLSKFPTGEGYSDHSISVTATDGPAWKG